MCNPLLWFGRFTKHTTATGGWWCEAEISDDQASAYGQELWQDCMCLQIRDSFSGADTMLALSRYCLVGAWTRNHPWTPSCEARTWAQWAPYVALSSYELLIPTDKIVSVGVYQSNSYVIFGCLSLKSTANQNLEEHGLDKENKMVSIYELLGVIRCLSWSWLLGGKYCLLTFDP